MTSFSLNRCQLKPSWPQPSAFRYCLDTRRKYDTILLNIVADIHWLYVVSSFKSFKVKYNGDKVHVSQQKNNTSMCSTYKLCSAT
jgi:hypothetical protein